jgi:hypothetical protein
MIKSFDQLKTVNGETRVLNEKENDMLIKLSFDELREGDNNELEQIISKELACHVIIEKLNKFSAPTRPTPQLIALLAVLSGGNPGKAVMWAFALHKRFYGQEVSIQDFVKAVMPWGVPTEDSMRECWESQKTPRIEAAANSTDNLLDREETWAAACRATS